MIHLLLLAILVFIELFFDVGIKDEKKRRMAKVLSMGLVLFLFAALRGQTVGIDIPGYVKNYKFVHSLSFHEIFDLKSGRDPVFTAFTKILNFVSPDPQFLLVVVGGVVAASFSYFVYHQKGNALMIYILFITFRVYAFTLTGLRQALAMAMIWIALTVLGKEKRILFVILVLIASLFHMSAFLALLLLPISWRKLNAKVFSVSAIVLALIDTLSGHAIIIFLSKYLMTDRFGDYLDESNLSDYSPGGTFYLYMALFLLAFAIVAFLVRKDDSDYQEMNDLLKYTSFAIMIYIMCQDVPVLFRISYYCIVPFYVLVARSVNRIFNGMERVVVHVGIISLLCFQYIWLTPGAGITDYVFFWQ